MDFDELSKKKNWENLLYMVFGSKNNTSVRVREMILKI